MKTRNLILTAMLLLVGTAARAQFEIGAKAGLGVSWIFDTKLIGYEEVVPHNGFYAGLLADYELDNYMMLQTELTYSAKGHSDKSQQDGKYHRDLGYINMPLYFGYKFTRSLSVMAGPEFGWLVNCTTNTDGNEVDGMDDCHKFDLGVAAQVNFMVNRAIGLDLKFFYSLTRTFDVPYYIDGKAFDDNGRNGGFQIGACYKFQLD